MVQVLVLGDEATGWGCWLGHDLYNGLWRGRGKTGKRTCVLRQLHRRHLYTCWGTFKNVAITEQSHRGKARKESAKNN
jgi:hypothetical protein